jgi:dihydrofolate synthase/folylpolyglutamate synthase
VITRISLEHTQYLGDTLDRIAAEKAGVIKAGVPVITAEGEGPALASIKRFAEEKGAPLRRVGSDIPFEMIDSTVNGTTVRLGSMPEVTMPLLGTFQAENAAMAYGVAIELTKRGVEVSAEAIRGGLGTVRWPGRLELVRRDPAVIFDVSHTPDGAAAVVKDIERLFGGKVTLILGVLNDKDLDGIVAAFAPIAKRAIAVSPESPRAFPSSQVALSLRRLVEDVKEEPSVEAALSSALASANREDVIVVAGSLYTVGEAKSWWEGHEAR